MFNYRNIFNYWQMGNVKRFANMNKNIFAKKHDYLGEDEVEEYYYDTLLFLFPDAIAFTIVHGYQPTDDIQSLKSAIFAKIADPEFIKYINGELNRKNKIENIQYVPLIILEMLQIAEQENKRLIENGYDPIDTTYLKEFSKTIKKFIFEDFYN